MKKELKGRNCDRLLGGIFSGENLVLPCYKKFHDFLLQIFIYKKLRRAQYFAFERNLKIPSLIENFPH